MAQGSIDDNSLTMLLLRVWMLAVPIAMLAAAVIFGGIAAAVVAVAGLLDAVEVEVKPAVAVVLLVLVASLVLASRGAADALPQISW